MDLHEESRGGYVVTVGMKKVWEVQMQLMRKLLEVCARHGLKVWIDGGSLLGAVREKGYIPWDDDIDMIMMRPDYDRLVALAGEFRRPYFLQCAHTDKGYARGHAQLRMDGTAAILRTDVNSHAAYHQGIFIDIFVFDGVPATREERLAAVAETQRRMKKLRVFTEYRPVRQVGPFIRKCFYRLKSFEQCFDWYEQSYRQFDLATHPRIYNWGCCLDKMETRGAIMAHWYDETVMLRFEDTMVPAPAGYHELLTALYGDYMTPRREPTVHGDVHFDTGRDYTEVMRRLRRGEDEF